MARLSTATAFGGKSAATDLCNVTLAAALVVSTSERSNNLIGRGLFIYLFIYPLSFLGVAWNIKANVCGQHSLSCATGFSVSMWLYKSLLLCWRRVK